MTDEDIFIMEAIDKIWTKCPFYGIPRITHQLRRNQLVVNHKRVYRLMKLMGIEAIFPKKSLSKRDKYHELYPYLLNGLTINKPNQVWGIDITYIRLKNDWLYLVAILDWFSRYILAWELSDSLSTSLYLTVLLY